MPPNVTPHQALCACEITYHLELDKQNQIVSFNQEAAANRIGLKRVEAIRQGLWGWGGDFEYYGIMDDGASCLITQVKKTKGIVIAFRGTVPFSFDLSTSESRMRTRESMKDGLRNILVKLVEGKEIDRKYGEGSQVHEGFSEEVDYMWVFILQTIQKIDPLGEYPITITGHSQGGAVAFLAALRLCVEAKNSDRPYRQQIGGRIEQVITFGAAQAGSQTFAMNYMKYYHFDKQSVCLDEITYRYENAGDCVPLLPNKSADVAGLFKKQFAQLPIMMSILELIVNDPNVKGSFEKYATVGNLRYIDYQTHEILTEKSHEERLKDAYKAWAAKGDKDVFSIHFCYTNDGYVVFNK